MSNIKFPIKTIALVLYQLVEDLELSLDIGLFDIGRI